MSMTKSDQLTRNVMKVVDQMEADKQSRSYSWVHCRRAFLQRSSLSDEELALHLAFFLASWGMYRGGSFLLQKDFSVHLPVVVALRSPEFDPLWDMAASGAHEDAMDLTLKLGNDIHSAYLHAAHVKSVTPVLVTKVLLGTVCCAPAFDTFVRMALGKRRMVQQFSPQGMCGIYQLYNDHLEEFTKIGKRLKAMGYDFPPMKLIDTALWVEGGGPVPPRRR